jgi:hypothetical protein
MIEEGAKVTVISAASVPWLDQINIVETLCEVHIGRHQETFQPRVRMNHSDLFTANHIPTPFRFTIRHRRTVRTLASSMVQTR